MCDVPALRFPEFIKSWECSILEKLSKKIGDGIHSTPSYDDNGTFYFINGNNLNGGKIVITSSTKRVSEKEAYKNNAENLEANSILMSINGTIGNVALYHNEPIMLGKSACYINSKDNIDKNYLFYYLQYPKTQLYFEAELTGTTIKNLSLQSIRKTKIYIPTIEEQHKISRFLQKIDERISTQNKIIEKYESLIQAIIYKEKMDGISTVSYTHLFVESHKRIMKFFDNAQVFGFTGTPIFTENAINGHTTKEIFGNCLHQYLIKDAIADENVLGFLVEYYHGSEEVEKGNANRMEEIAKFILNNFNKSTFDGEFDALFAVQSVPILIRYYKIFKSLKPKIRIGAVFTYAANSSQDDEQTGMNTGQYVSESTGEADELQAIMDDYNEMFGTAFTTENFRAYYDDINLRMKKKRADMKPLDLCLVVGMFLTGFDSKKLNTLYVDKNLEYHGLLQAFSRTNRVLNEKKRFGKIICFRDLKSNVDTAIRLFSNSNNPEEIVRPPFEDVKKEYQQLATDFLQKYPEPSSIDLLQSEKDKKDFVLAFRDIIRKHAEIQIYEDYSDDADDLGMTEQQFMDFRSKYLDIHDTFVPSDMPSASPSGGDETPSDERLEDVDFCLELLHSDIINVAYILELIANLNPYSTDYAERRKNIIDTMIKDAEMRNKAKLIDGFIQKNVDEDKENFMARRQKADGTSELEERLNRYISTEREKAVNSLAQDEGLSSDVLDHYLKEYDYLQKEQPEIIQKALKEKHLGLIKTRKALTRIMDRLRSIIRTFSWD